MLYPRVIIKPGRQTGKAQATLELSIAIFCTLILLLGAFKICFWVNQRLVLRQEAYEGDNEPQYGRVIAGQATGDGETPLKPESAYPALEIFK